MLTLDVLTQLRRLLEDRKIQAGIAVLEQNRAELGVVEPSLSHAAFVVSCLAQWVDVGFDDRGVLQQILGRFTRPVRQQLPLPAYVNIRLAEALLAMRHDDGRATLHLDAVLNLEDELEDGKFGVIARLWKARCLRKAGEYERALLVTREGLARAEALSLTHLTALLRTLESWMVFQRGQPKEAVLILQGAEAVLRDTDDFITLGNIQSAYGRIAMREGRYDHALRYFEGSISYFQQLPALVGYMARSLSNIAQAKRFLALQVRRSLEAQHQRSAHNGGDGAVHARRLKSGLLERMHELLLAALEDLAKADVIYRAAGNHHGAGNVAVNRSQVHLDRGDLEEAEICADRAFELGGTKGDFLVMCRARIAQAALQNARYEDQIEEGGDPSQYAQRAHDCAREAVDFAERTQSKRLMAEAQLAQGITYVNGFFQNTEAARACCHRAETALGQDRHDALWQEVEMLRARILHAGIEDPNLRAWSEGAVGEKSLQDVVGEFEELLIRRVWEREDRKVSRVAHKLSVSPKKVRRILRQMGLLVEAEGTENDFGSDV